MKFRTIIKDDLVIRQFVNILISFAKMDKNIMINLKKEKMVIFICCEDVQTKPICWMDIESSTYFTSYFLNGDSPQYDEIYFVLNSSKIIQSLSGTHRCVNYFRLKLAKNPFESLVIDTEVTGITSNHKKTMQLPILIIPRRNWSNYHLPTDLQYDMTVITTNLKRVRSIVESAKTLSPEITICIQRNGTMGFVLENDEFTTTVQMTHLPIKIHTKSLDEVSCVVNCRKFAAILSQHNFPHATTSFSIRQDRVFKCEFEVKRNVMLTCLLPCIYLDDGE
ncbi:checkpoint protein HUS1B-like [Culicoides brevitarsis]|uniref:checkpoint protein HUS1B-like n=1 Tax=Culicoides brevitarsis TaxID=469753 RepID=UPI00307C60BB